MNHYCRIVKVRRTATAPAANINWSFGAGTAPKESEKKAEETKEGTEGAPVKEAPAKEATPTKISSQEASPKAAEKTSENETPAKGATPTKQEPAETTTTTTSTTTTESPKAPDTTKPAFSFPVCIVI